MRLPDYIALQGVYGETEKSHVRFAELAENYCRCFGKEQMEFFSAPGRTEIIGNHTDHNGGMVLAASIDLDTIGAAFPNESGKIELVSEGYEGKIVVNVADAEKFPTGQGTESLVAGMVAAMKKFGYRVSGFSAYIATNVISSAGVSSSASFEMLFCSMVNYFFNEGKLTDVAYAEIGQYAENYYWNKDSGLMDQMACAVGGTVLFDFSSHAAYQKIDFDFEEFGYNLVIVNTGKGHADLSREYSEIPLEMKEMAEKLGVSKLVDSNLQSLLEVIKKAEKSIANDRAILRALHFFQENSRVSEAAEAIREKDSTSLLQLINASGKSSWELLQNCYSAANWKEQKVTLCLALTELFLKEKGDGVCRVHGGGFAGVILSVLPNHCTEAYIRYIASFVGRENVYPLKIRKAGAIHLEKREH